MYDKSALIKDSYITDVNKKVSLYGSTSYFNKKTENEILKIVSPENLLKFLIEKDTVRNNLSFHLASISGSVPTLKDKKIHDLSLTKLGRKRKLPMQEPIETVIIRAQQNFGVAGGLNPIQIKIEDDRVLNMLKKRKNVIYKLTPIGILFPACIQNDTRQVFFTCTELNDVKKSLINGNIYGLLGITNLKKINNWEEKGQSIWINADLGEQKEINNIRHICFPFATKTLNDLLSFSIYLIDDSNNELTFLAGEKKIRILNFKIDVFLR